MGWCGDETWPHEVWLDKTKAEDRKEELEEGSKVYDFEIIEMETNGN